MNIKVLPYTRERLLSNSVFPEVSSTSAVNIKQEMLHAVALGLIWTGQDVKNMLL